MKARTLLIGLIVLGLLGVGGVSASLATRPTHPVTAKTTVKPVSKAAQVTKAPRAKKSAVASKSQKQLKKLINRDMRGVGGRWSVKVTRLGQQPLTVTTGNRAVKRQRAASTIKLFIMLTIFQKAQRHQLTVTAATRQQLQRMIYNSDNVAANQLIAKAGGLAAVNRVIAQHHFTQSHLGRHLMDTQALRRGHDNWTSVRDLTRFLTLTTQHRLLGATTDKQMLTLLRHCRNHSKLPLLVKNVTVYNKTGEYPDLGVQNDAALFKTPQGRKITVVVMSQSGNGQRQYPAMNHLGRDVVRALR